MNVVVREFPEDKWRDFKSTAIQKGLRVKDALTEAVEKWTKENKNGSNL